MNDELRSASAIVEEWLMRAESVAAHIPSWLPSARNGLPEVAVMPAGAVEVAIARASAGPLSSAVRSSLVPGLADVQAAFRAEPEDIANRDLREENQSLRRQLAEMATAMARMRADVLEASEGELVGLACAVAERVVGHALRTDPSLVVAWAREAIEALGAHEDVVIAVSSDLAAIVPPADWALLTGKSCRVETDASLGPLVCEVRTRTSVVDASAQARLGAVAHELGVTGA